MTIQIRPYQYIDLPQIQTLNTKVKPYRPEDTSIIDAMKEHARAAQVAGDPRWIHDAPPLPSLEEAVENYLGFWVAVDEATGNVMGMVGIDFVGRGPEIHDNMPFAEGWRGREDVAELRYVRVDPDCRRQGVGTLLNQTAIDWCHANGFQRIICNTTSPQLPALKL
ncbi:MAG: GNAT family N-acetyltransferase [Chloroflexota bacterium]